MAVSGTNVYASEQCCSDEGIEVRGQPHILGWDVAGMCSESPGLWCII